DPNNTTAWVWPAGLYANTAGAPGYEECDQNNATGTIRPTHASGAKIDYTFSSLPKNWCTVTTTPHSDHRVLKASKPDDPGDSDSDTVIAVVERAVTTHRTRRGRTYGAATLVSTREGGPSGS
ncbi:hypothetical protein ACIRO3_30110, partial [Streptomyces sp. NPDC102278]